MAHLKRGNGHLLRTGPAGIGHLVRACTNGCEFVIYQDNCQLFWYVTTTSTDFTVAITGPGVSDNYSYDSIRSGVFDEPTDGLWFGVVTLNDIGGGCLSSTEYTTPADPCLPCCRKTDGVYFSVHSAYDNFEESRERFVSGVAYERLYSIWDLSAFHYDGYRIGSMISGSKTAENCYTRYGATEEFTVGQATRTWYTGIPHTTGDPVCVGVPVTDYYYQKLYYDIIVRFAVTGPTEYLVLLKVTSEDFLISGTPNGTIPPAPVIGTETVLINSAALGALFTLSWGACHFIQHVTGVDDFDYGGYTDCVNTGDITMEIWADVSVP